MLLDLDAFRRAPAHSHPYPHVVMQGFLPPQDVTAVIRDFPRVDMAGLFLPEAAPYGPAFGALLAELEGPGLRREVGEKLGLDLTGRPTLVTVRSCCQGRDGQIHADSKFKLATVLLYLNEPWGPQGGRLRVLRSGANLDDYVAEVPPDGGSMICFRVQPNSWHGHKPFVGPRRYVMLNYCMDERVRDSEAARHRMSGRIKKVARLFGIGRVSQAA
jgi:SM-20-related protein